MQGWQRSMRWPQTERAWVATSPNIPTFEAALVYPGIGIVGETEVSEGAARRRPSRYSARLGSMRRAWRPGSMRSAFPA